MTDLNTNKIDATQKQKKILDNLLGLYRFKYTGTPGIKLTDNDDLFMYESTIPALNHHTFNRVVYCDTDRQGVNEIIKIFGDKSCLFWIPPESKPDNISDILKSSGFTFIIDCPAMTIELSKLDDSIVIRHRELEIIEVINKKGSADFTSVYDKEYDRIPTEGEMMGKRFDETKSPDSPWRKWAGYLDSRPVTISASFTTNSIVGIYSVSTLPEYRGRGFGSVMTNIPLLAAKKSGAELAVLQATDKSVRIYEKLGFIQHGVYGVWVRQ
ncbi:MAG: GNAT family N-acetyltransferase [Caldisericia bacterium]|nr:GNAT family N-acetyltransferase [Caldisericia bacterium]